MLGGQGLELANILVLQGGLTGHECKETVSEDLGFWVGPIVKYLHTYICCPAICS
jgi:hypothetical protein